MNTEAKVGAFVIAGLLVLAVTVYFVRSTQDVRGQVAYTTYLRYAGGISPGTAVLFGGIRVGQVTAVHPSSADPTRIEVTFAVQAGTPVNEQSTARVGSVSLMSSPAVFLSTGSNEARRLKAGEAVRSQEVVSQDEVLQRLAGLADSAQALMKELQHEVPALAAEARGVLANLNEISGARNQKRIEGILVELDTVLKRESPKIAQITDRVSVLAEHADQVMAAARPLVTNIDRTVNNVNATVDAIREPLAKDLDELRRTMEDARALLGSVQNVVGANEAEIRETVRTLRATSDNLYALSETLKQRPWNLLRTTQPADRKVPQ